MSEMGDWIGQMLNDGVFTRPGGEGPVPAPPPEPTTRAPDPGQPALPPPDDGRLSRGDPPPVAPPPGTPPYPGAPPWAGDPSIPAPLEMFLRQYYSGHTTLPQEFYDLYGGDQILTAMKQFDPNASWTYSDVGGGEGASSAMGYKLNFDERKLPAPAGPLGWSRPTNAEGSDLFHPEMKYYDPNYGWVTDARNINHHNGEGLDKWAPYIGAAISMLAPMAAPAMFGALGATAVPAGFTSGVTAGAAGLGAGATPGALGAFGGGNAWWTKPAFNGIRTGGSLASGLSPPTSPTPAPTRPPIPKNATMPDPYGFDPSAYNRGGSAAKPGGNDSKLVATEFADDPYRFSRG